MAVKKMTVAGLIKLLEKYPEDLFVAYKLFSEQALLEPHEIEVKSLGEPRPDGWVHNARPDKPTLKYLVFPGN